MMDYSRDGNQIVAEEVTLEDGCVYVISVVNGKCICFEKGILDFSKLEDVGELLRTSSHMGLGTDESELLYPMIYGKERTFVELYSFFCRGCRFAATVGDIDGLPFGLNEKVRTWMNEYE